MRPALSAMIKDHSVIGKGAGKRGDPHLYSLSRKTSDTEQKVAAENSGFLVPTIDAEPENQKPDFDLNNCNDNGYSGSRDFAFSDTFRNQKKKSGNQYSEPHYLPCNRPCHAPRTAWIKPAYQVIEIGTL